MTNPLYSAHPKMFKNNPFYFLVCIALCFVIVGVALLATWYLSAKASKLTITESDILFERGLLSKSRTEISLRSVRTVNVNQSFANRIFGTGDIRIFTAGDSPEIVARGFPDPNKVRDIIKQNQNKIA